MPHMDVAQAENSQFPEDHVIRITDGASRWHLVASFQKMSYAIKDVIVDRSVGHQPGTVAEVGRPTLQHAVEPIPHFWPRSHIVGSQEIARFCPESCHTFLRRTSSKIPMAILPIVMRPERITKKVEAFFARWFDARFRFVQSEPQLSHDTARPIQCLLRFVATQDHKIISVVHDMGLKTLLLPAHPPVLQETVHVQVGKHGADYSTDAKDNLVVEGPSKGGVESWTIRWD